MNLTKNAPASRFPTANYKLRITEQPELKESSQKNLMLVYNCECVGYVNSNGTVQPTVSVDGQEVEVVGYEFQFWATFFMDKKTGEMKNIGLAQLHAALNLPTEINLDPVTNMPITVDGTPIDYTGQEFYARCQSKVTTPTGPDGKPLVNPVTGKPVEQSQRRIVEIYAA